MSQKYGGAYARRRLVPHALKRVFTGALPSQLLEDLKLLPDTRFETLSPVCVNVADRKVDRRLLDCLTALAEPALTSWKIDLQAPSFPAGVASSINLTCLPLLTRTRNCLEKNKLLSVDSLQRLSLEELLAIPGFGVKCLVDLLTAVEATNPISEKDFPPTEVVVFLPQSRVVLPSPRRRGLVPEALRTVFTGLIPPGLAKDLKLPDNSRFETLTPPWVDVGDRKDDRDLLDHLTILVDAALTLRKLDLNAAAFPTGVNCSINFARLPLHTRTRTCLEKLQLISAVALQRQTLADLLTIRSFGLKCLVDLLTAVEAVNRPAIGDETATESVSLLGCEVSPLAEPIVPPTLEAPTLLPRLTREARLLGHEPWAKEVSLYDIRIGASLLKDKESLKDVREALAAQRIPLDRLLCPEAPRCDLDLLRCPLLTRTKNCLQEAKLTTLIAVASLTLRQVSKCSGLGPRGLADLLTVLDVCRFSTMSDHGASEPTIAEFCEAVVNRTSDAWFPERLADRIHQTRAFGIRCLSLKLEEELRDVAVAASLSRPEITIEYLGLDGRGRRTLEEVGSTRELSREAVRQMVVRTTDRLASASAWVPILRQAMETCCQHCPLPVEEIATLLQQKELATVPFHPYGLLTASESLRQAHTFTLRHVGETDWLLQGKDETLLRNCLEIAQSAVAKRGVCSLGDLQAELSEHVGEDIGEDILREWVDRFSGVRWLDGDRQWFRFGAVGSSLETNLWKILAVAPAIQLCELREGLTRHHRSSSVPPLAILRQLCRHLELHVDEDLVCIQKPIHPEEVLSEVEFTFFDILRASGPLLPSSKLEKSCLDRGMNRHTFSVYLSYSPILAQYARGVFGLRGAQIAPGEAEALRPQRSRSRVVEDYGWKRSGVAWIAYTVTDSLIRTGVVGMPAGMNNALGEGSWPLLTMDQTRVGTLVSRGGAVWGLGPFFHRRGADIGDTMILEIDRKASLATIRVGGPELLDQVRRDLPVILDLPDDT